MSKKENSDLAERHRLQIVEVIQQFQVVHDLKDALNAYNTLVDLTQNVLPPHFLKKHQKKIEYFREVHDNLRKDSIANGRGGKVPRILVPELFDEFYDMFHYLVDKQAFTAEDVKKSMAVKRKFSDMGRKKERKKINYTSPRLRRFIKKLREEIKRDPDYDPTEDPMRSEYWEVYWKEWRTKHTGYPDGKDEQGLHICPTCDKHYKPFFPTLEESFKKEEGTTIRPVPWFPHEQHESGFCSQECKAQWWEESWKENWV